MLKNRFHCSPRDIYGTTKTKYYADKIEECGTDRKALFNVINSLQQVFHHKDISNQTKTMSFTGISDSESSNISLDIFRPATEEEVFKIISKSPKKSCALNPIPAGFFIDILPTLLTAI